MLGLVIFNNGEVFFLLISFSQDLYLESSVKRCVVCKLSRMFSENEGILDDQYLC